jgi:hypothetical protein
MTQRCDVRLSAKATGRTAAEPLLAAAAVPRGRGAGLADARIESEGADQASGAVHAVVSPIAAMNAQTVITLTPGTVISRSTSAPATARRSKAVAASRFPRKRGNAAMPL